jgi:hypothetical protein
VRKVRQFSYTNLNNYNIIFQQNSGGENKGKDKAVKSVPKKKEEREKMAPVQKGKKSMAGDEDGNQEGKEKEVEHIHHDASNVVVPADAKHSFCCHHECRLRDWDVPLHICMVCERPYHNECQTKHELFSGDGRCHQYLCGKMATRVRACNMDSLNHIYHAEFLPFHPLVSYNA